MFMSFRKQFLFSAKPVALKIIKNVVVSNSNTMLNETNILGWVHPNIVRVFKVSSLKP